MECDRVDVEGRRASQLRVTASVGTVGVPDRIHGPHAYCSMCEFRKQEVHGSCLSSVRIHDFSPHLGEVARASLARVTELCGAAFFGENLFYTIKWHWGESMLCVM